MKAAALLHERPRLAEAALALALVGLLAAQVSFGWRPGDDSCSYLSIARSMAEGRPANLGDPHLYYSPGYPALIAPLFLLGERPFLAISILQFACAVMWVLAVVVAARRWIPPTAPRHVALLVPALVGVNTGVWTYTRLFLSEVPFAAAFAWSLVLFDAALAAERPGRRRALLAGGTLLAAVACSIRPVGLAAPLGLAAMLVVRAARGRIPWGRAVAGSLAAALPALAVVVGIAAWDASRAAGVSDTYVAQAFDPDASWPARIAEGIRLRVAEVGRILLPGMSKSYSTGATWFHPTMLLYVPVAFVVARGAIRLSRRTGTVAVPALALYVLAYLLWPNDQGIRFMTPVVAVLWISALEGLRFEGQAARFALGLLLAGHLAASGYGWMKDRSVWDVHPWWPAVDKVAGAVWADRDRVASLGVDRRIARMLQLRLDRRVEVVADDAVPSERVRWLLRRQEGPVPAGFTDAGWVGPGVSLAVRASRSP